MSSKRRTSRIRLAALLAAMFAAWPTIGAQLTAKNRQDLVHRLTHQVRDQLRDPETARFFDLQLFLDETGATISLCGLINAKNAYGGYIGKHGFVSSVDGLVVLEGEPGAAAFSSVRPVWCHTKL